MRQDFLDDGGGDRPRRIIPVNTHGGQFSHGRTRGMGLIQEAVAVARRGGERQVADSPVAVSPRGLTPAACCCCEQVSSDREGAQGSAMPRRVANRPARSPDRYPREAAIA